MVDSREPRLDPVIFNNDEERPSCAACGVCCHNQSILITDEDVRRILAAKPSIPIEELVIFYTPADGYVDDSLLERYPSVKIEGERCYLALRFISDDATAGRVCPFLDGASGLCTIHEFKPLICRVYPFIYDIDLLTRVDNPRCPENWHPRNGNEISRLHSVLKRAYDEFNEFRKRTEKWNRRSDCTSFIDFFGELFGEY
ncbi:MAG: YkgJ family cysteine cluster protein [Promethearchaeota archaeon]